ncbi:MAG: hypothetical protein CL938_09140 [Deltaproteobacteria bacterium]|jgi:ribosomal protein S18 acetylase RimI-like enzyme|nr:hypothetical protein [Deltaproteobacteria bacterium]
MFSAPLSFQSRPASGDDVELLRRIQREALGASVEAVFGTTEAEQRAFFDARFDWRDYQIICVRGEAAGFLMWEERGDYVYLGNLALLPRFQRRGVDAGVLAHVVERAEALGLPVRLQVLRGNPARNFYARHGFEEEGQTETHVLMGGPVGPGEG